MDSGELSSIVAILGGALTYFGAGSLVPDVGPAIQGILALITLGAAAWSWYIHRQVNAAAA